MIVPLDKRYAGGAYHSAMAQQQSPMGITPEGLPNNPLFGSSGTNPIYSDPGVYSAIDYHQQDMQKFAQSVSDTNMFWGMFNAETTTKASIVGVLTKLEDKYQVRG